MTSSNSARRVRIRLAGALLVLVAAPAFMELTHTTAQQNQVRGWPSIAAETRPWTRWWWQGSAVERRSLSAQLQSLAAAGIGGVEITPIYGVRGAEDRFIPYLSPRWMEMLDYTLTEAARLKLGVDMATGTGWPFGGPWVGDDPAPRSLVHKTWTLTGGERLTEPVTLRQTPLVRAIGNQIHIVNEGAPGDPPRGAATQAPVIRPEARAIQIADLVEPVSANRNLQALALEQVKYPRDLPLTLLMAYSDTGDAVDLTSRVQTNGAWTGWRVRAGGRSMRSSPDGMASSSSAQPPAAKGMSSIIFRRTQSGSTCCRSIVLSRGTAWTDSARSSTIPTRSTMRRGRRTGRRACSMSSRSAAATISSALATLLGKGTDDDQRACAGRLSGNDIGPAARHVHDRVGIVGATPRTSGAQPGARIAREHPRPVCRQRFARDRRRRDSAVQMGDVRRARRRTPPRVCGGRQPGSASTFACGSPRSRRQSISSSSPA